MKTEKNNISFEDAMKRLEEITRLLSNNEITLDESIKLYEEGKNLQNICENKLSEAELKIQIIDKKNDKLVKSDFDAE